MKKELSTFEKLLLQKGDVEMVTAYIQENAKRLNYLFRHYAILFLEQAMLDETAKKILQRLKDEQETLDTKISDCNVSRRLLNICEQENIQTLGDFTLYTRLDFARLHNCGRKTVREVEDLLDSLLLSFKSDDSSSSREW